MAGEIAQLKQLQAGINAAFESLFKITEDDPNNEKEIAAAKQQIGTMAQITFGAALGPVFSIVGLTKQQHAFAAVRIAIDLNLFEIISKPTTLDELVQKTNADPMILQRILRAVCAIGYLKQTAIKTWEPTPISQALTAPPIRDWCIVHFDERMVITGKFPAWLKKRGYNNTGSIDDCVLSEVLGENCWDHFEHHPEMSATFDSAMSLQESFPPAMVPPYPFAGKEGGLSTGAGAVTLVDIGGGFGQAIKKIRGAYPEIKGRFILQDLPKTIKAIDAAQAKQDGLELMEHDFFKPQPVKGAKYYHLRRVLHDWNDGPSIKILEATREAMKETPDYSRLLIHEFVLPDVGCGFVESMVDLMMMQTCDGMERTESHWHDLLGKTGFKILNISRADVGTTAVIEAALA